LTRIEAIKLLASGTSHERLKAARAMVRNALVEDLPLLRRARQAESVSYVKTSLDVGIARLSNMPLPPKSGIRDEMPVLEVVRQKVMREATEWVTGLLLHEIASPIGLMSRTASREIPNYELSKTKRHADRVKRIFAAIEQLKSAATLPKPEQFDLTELINDVVIMEASSAQAKNISLHGPKPMMITSDPMLVRFVVRNGLRNALEAVSEVAASDRHSIVVTWGETDVDYFVAILDRGPGIAGPIDAAFEIGKSTKLGHSGFGLAIARQAIETLGGKVVLQPGNGGGALYEARWER